MKNSTINLMLAAAALMVASSVASAQDLKAQIPFSFRVNGVVMAPGAYDVAAAMGEQRFRLINVALGASVLMGAGLEADAPKAWRSSGKPTLEFTCRDGNCSLTRIWTGGVAAAHTYSMPHSKNDAHTVASIRLVNVSLK